MKSPDALWQRFMHALPADAHQQRHAAELVEHYLQRGYLPQTNTELLQMDDAVIVRFYALLAERRPSSSPVTGFKDSSWMADSDFCFINIRATGVGDAFGNLLTACKLFPGIRADALHLGPFTRYALGGAYSINSTRSISAAVIHKELDRQGLDAEQQLRALVQAAHLLGKTVGFDLEPHTAQFAVTVIMQPHCFRWIKLAPNRDALAWDIDPQAAGDETVQRCIVEEVVRLRDSRLADARLSTLEEEPGDDAARLAYKECVYNHLVRALIAQGCWTIPSQAWNCLGIPGFDGYNHEHDYAKFRYRTPAGEDAHHQAFHTLTPFKFYQALPVNSAPTRKPALVEDAVDAFVGIFEHWRDRFDFDFVRFDSVDHIVDSAQADDDSFALSDRPTPAILRRLTQAHKSEAKPWIANLAERMGNEIEDYRAMGFDAMLGNDMLQRVDRPLMEKSFELYQRLQRINTTDAKRFTVTFAIDTHDTGNENIWGEPLIKLMGFERMRLRHFVSRFISCGAARRPKYEVMGLSDLSYGLYRANVSELNLVWQNDQAFNRLYHRLEDVYTELKPGLAAAEIIDHFVADDFAWWTIRHARGLWLAIVSLETAHARPIGHIRVERPYLHGRLGEFSFSAAGRSDYGALHGTLDVFDLDYLGFRLFEIV